MRIPFILLVSSLWIVACSSPPGGDDPLPDATPAIDAVSVTIDASLPADAAVAAPDAAIPTSDGGLSIACTLEEILPLAQCAFDNCGSGFDLDAGLDTTQLATCVAVSCFSELLSLSPDCVDCVTSGISGDVAVLLSTCTGISAP